MFNPSKGLLGKIFWGFIGGFLGGFVGVLLVFYWQIPGFLPENLQPKTSATGRQRGAGRELMWGCEGVCFSRFFVGFVVVVVLVLVGFNVF